MNKLLLAALLPVLTIFSATEGYAAERAASIEYEFIGRPANLPRNFEEHLLESHCASLPSRLSTDSAWRPRSGSLPTKRRPPLR
jgi:hypothetical protein